jgi:delta-aminolevulinic acid dehydratase/porphobilinogen synthase
MFDYFAAVSNALQVLQHPAQHLCCKCDCLLQEYCSHMQQGLLQDTNSALIQTAHSYPTYRTSTQTSVASGLLRQEYLIYTKTL